MALTQIPPLPIVLVFCLVLTCYILYGIVYRLYLSPIANFPGPKLAAVTFWYECYYDVLKGGRYSWKIADLHEKYGMYQCSQSSVSVMRGSLQSTLKTYTGPIIRINPYELHVIDHDFYDVLYTGYSQKRNKWPWAAKVFTNPRSVFSTVPHDVHRLRRTSLNPFFSKRSVANFAGTIQATTEHLCHRLTEYMLSGIPANLTLAYSALSTDIMSDYAFGKSYGCVTMPEFAPEWYAMVNTPLKLSAVVAHFGWLLSLAENMPVCLAKWTSATMHRLLLLEQVRDSSSSHVLASNIVALKGYHQQVLETDATRLEDTEKPSQQTIFRALLGSDLPPQEKSIERLVDEAKTLIGAGVTTTAHTLETLTYHLLTNVDILATLKAELRSAIPDASQPVSLQKLEQLPYLTAVIKEGLRMAYGASHRLSRVAPDKTMMYKDWVIPAGTPVSMTNMLTHINPQIFPEPHRFSPKRWLDQSQNLDKYLMSFGRGTRACIGINLAWAELYIVLATVFRRFDFELYETSYEDVEIVHDYFTPYPKHDSNGVRVKTVSMDA